MNNYRFYLRTKYLADAKCYGKGYPLYDLNIISFVDIRGGKDRGKTGTNSGDADKRSFIGIDKQDVIFKEKLKIIL